MSPRLFACVFAVLCAAPVLSAQASAPQRTVLQGAPLHFEPNRGQSDPAVRFLARGTDYGLFLTDDEAVMRLRLTAQPQRTDTPTPPLSAVLRLRLDGAQPARPQARKPQQGHSNYLSLDGEYTPIGTVPHYSELVYRDRYPGIDQVFYGSDGELEYDFVLAPGADPAAIALHFDGADRLHVDDNGDLHIEVAGHTLVQHAPVAFQYADATADASSLRANDGTRTVVSSRYMVGDDGRVRFMLGAYDRSRSLVIDPIFAWSNCLGGSAEDSVNDIAVAGNGDVFVTGSTNSTDFPVAHPIQGYSGAGDDIFVTHLNAAGSGATYSTYIGTSSYHLAGLGIAVNGAGEAYVTGMRQSLSTGHIQALLLKLNAAGSALVFSDAFGGTGNSLAEDLALDSSGNPVVVGLTDSNDFPVLNALQSTKGDPVYADGFVRRYNSAGTVLSSTYLGGANDQHLYAVALGTDNAIYVAGQTYLLDPDGDAYVSKLDANAATLVYHHKLIGSLYDAAFDIAVDGSGRAFVVGATDSTDFPVANAIDSTYGGGRDGFLTVLDPTGANLVTSTFLGNADSETVLGVAIGPGGDVFLTGNKNSDGGNDAPFLTKLGPTFTTVGYGIRLGYSDYDGEGRVVRVDAAGAAYVGGFTRSGHYFPSTPGAFEQCVDGSTNGFVSKVIDGSATVSIADASVAEGNTNQARQLTVTLSAPLPNDVSFDFATSNGTAFDGVDYFGGGGTGWIAAGSLSTTIEVVMNGDTLDEADETFSVDLSNIVGAGAADTHAVVTIIDDDAPPTVFMDDGTPGEDPRCSEVIAACFIYIKLSAPSGRTVSGTWSTANGGAMPATAGLDYTAVPATAFSFAPGETYLSISVPYRQDALDEPDETFLVNLAGLGNAASSGNDTQATFTIVDDDSPPMLTIADRSCVEGNTGTTPCAFTITLDGPSGKTVSGTYSTVVGGATPATVGVDFAAVSAGSWSIAPGASSATVNVVVTGDALDEVNETFLVNLAGLTNATAVDNDTQAVGTITDDDSAPTVNIADKACTEGNGGSTACTFTVSLSAASSLVVSGVFATGVGGATPATAGTDYTAVGGTAWSIGAGSTTTTINVNVLGDTLDEANETFLVTLSALANAAATGNDLQAVATINDDDAAPTVSIADKTCSEGNSGSMACSFTVTLSAVSGQTVGGNYATASGGATPATAGTDYAAVAATAWSIAPGQSSTTVNVSITGDTLDEANETFLVNLSSLANTAASGNDLQATGTISDDDAANGQLRMSECVAEISELVANIQLTVERVNGSNGAIGITYATANGTALAGSDYTATSGTLSWPSGDATLRTITVPLINNVARENREDFHVNLSAPTGGASLVAPNASHVWILDGQDQVFVDGFDLVPPCS